MFGDKILKLVRKIKSMWEWLKNRDLEETRFCRVSPHGLLDIKKVFIKRI